MSCLIGLFTTAFILAILALLDRKLDCQPSPQGFSLREWAKKALRSWGRDLLLANGSGKAILLDFLFSLLYKIMFQNAFMVKILRTF